MGGPGKTPISRRWNRL